MKTKRFVCLLLALLCLLSALSSCHGEPVKLEKYERTEDFDTSKKYEISFWAKNDTNIKQTEIYKKAISDFEKIYPNVKVNIRLYTNYGDIYKDVITSMSTATTPNVCITYPDHIATYLKGNNIVVPLDDLMTDKEYGLGGSKVKFDSPKPDEMIPEFTDECKIGGVTYALPYMRSSELCYVNKTYVNDLGYILPDVLTWDYMWKVANAAAEKKSDGTYRINGQKTMLPVIYKSTDNMMIQMLAQKNAPYSNENGEVFIENDVTKEILYEISNQTRTGAFSTFKSVGYPANYLNKGQCIFAIDSSAGSTWMGTNAPLSDISSDSIVNFEVEARLIPQFDPDNPKMISQGPSVCIFNKDDEGTVLASWLFAQFLLTNDVQLAYSQTEGYLPVTSKAQESDEYKDYLARAGEDNDFYYDVKIKASKLLLENMSNTFVTPVFAGSADLRDAAGHLIEETAKSTKRKKTVDEKFMNELFENTSSLYKLNEIEVTGNTAQKSIDTPLPYASKILIGTLISVWILILSGTVIKKFADKHKESGKNR